MYLILIQKLSIILYWTISRLIDYFNFGATENNENSLMRKGYKRVLQYFLQKSIKLKWMTEFASCFLDNQFRRKFSRRNVTYVWGYKNENVLWKSEIWFLLIFLSKPRFFFYWKVINQNFILCVWNAYKYLCKGVNLRPCII